MKKICIITGTRAEYGLLKPLIDALNNDNSWKVSIIATGMHLSKEFGETYKSIENDGINIVDKIEILLSSDSGVSISKSMGLAMISMSESLSRLNPDILLVLGDRFEIFCAASVASILTIPIVHLHGGELTIGAFDDAFRHSITKMSHLHFCSTEDYRKRVIQLGENPDRVFNVGAIGLDNIKTMNLLDRDSLEKDLEIKLLEKNFLVTFHPVTLESDFAEIQFQELLDFISTQNRSFFIFTKANADTKGRAINKMIDDFVLVHKENTAAFFSLGQLRYLSMMRLVDGVIGNSSSGIIEGPSFKVPTINIGNRQKGRLQSKNVVNCDPNFESIKNAFEAIQKEDFLVQIKSIISPYGDGNTTNRILDVLNSTDISKLHKKEFFDIK